MTLAELFLILITLSVQCSGIPTVLQIRAKQATDPNESPFTFIMFVINGFIQITYSILTQQIAIFVAGICGTALGIFYVSTFYQFGHPSQQKQISQTLTASFMLGVLFYSAQFMLSWPITFVTQSMGFMASFAGIALMASPLAVLRTVIKHENSMYIARSTAVTGTISSIAWLLYGFKQNDVFIWSPNVPAILFCFIQLFLLGRYPSKSKQSPTAKKPILTTNPHIL